MSVLLARASTCFLPVSRRVPKSIEDAHVLFMKVSHQAMKVPLRMLRDALA